MGRVDFELWRFKLRGSLIRHLPLLTCLAHRCGTCLTMMVLINVSTYHGETEPLHYLKLSRSHEQAGFKVQIEELRR